MAVQKADMFDGKAHDNVASVILFGNGSDAVIEGDIAALDLSVSTQGLGNHVKQGTAALGALACGIFTEGKTAAEAARGVLVQVRGARKNCNVAATTAAGSIIANGGTAGRGVALESLAPAGNTYNTATTQTYMKLQSVGVSLTVADGDHHATVRLLDPLQLAE